MNLIYEAFILFLPFAILLVLLVLLSIICTKKEPIVKTKVGTSVLLMQEANFDLLQNDNNHAKFISKQNISSLPNDIDSKETFISDLFGSADKSVQKISHQTVSTVEQKLPKSIEKVSF